MKWIKVRAIFEIERKRTKKEVRKRGWRRDGKEISENMKDI
jgi:hypothetical protein